MLARLIAYLIILLAYWSLGWLNFSQAGKSALIGALAILAVSAWTTRKGAESAGARRLNLLTFFLFLGIIVFQAFLRDLFGVAHDDMLVIEALFGTNSNEASEFLLQNIPYLLKHFAVMLLCLGAYWRILGRPLNRPRALGAGSGKIRADRARNTRLAAVFTFLFLLIHLNPTMRKQDPLLYFPLRYLKWQKGIEEVRVLQEKLAAATSADPALASLHYAGETPRTVVFVLGESTTRLNWSMYGYPRRTTPQLEALGDELLRFTDVVSSDGSTVLSMEKILTPATLQQPFLWQETPDLLTMAAKAGYKTFWITNHGTDASGPVSIFAGNADTMVITNSGGSRGEGNYDEVVLPHLEQALADPAERKFILLHLLGAHPAYYFRYPESFARFNNSEDAVSRQLAEAGRAFWAITFRNYYDNAMLYADHVLRQTIETCRKHTDRPIAWLFAPDHGEDVAHYTNFVGHNTRVPSMYEVPFLFWRSADFPQTIRDPQKLVAQPYQMDALDHTLLGLMRIEGAYYDSRRDIFSADFQPVPRLVAGLPYGPRGETVGNTVRPPGKAVARRPENPAARSLPN